ncbi:heme exporter protein CcmB [Pseudoduganella sp. SL102]|uniref:heme exporter protein CcmB n=1 Tax=Pseudoduganella sp. SL102 TaxID=2995154 RepID=UPI00248C1FEA|nr:heme exporter protein CcmB [Pseudoduganella sp. SL102]WBS00972.1 heme exporter protein CcmB [Pseudoduganella sp. SL102]
MLTVFLRAVRHGLLCSMRQPAELAAPLAFFVMVASLFPLGIGADGALLLRIAPGAVWICALLAALLGLHRLFEPDRADGTLEQLLLAPGPTTLLVAGRIAAHWLTSGVPLALASPIVALQYGMEPAVLAILVAGLLPGTAVFSLVGAVGAALTLGSRGGSVLTALILVPLYMPVLILGSGAVAAALTGTDPAAHLMLLGALSCAALALAPWATTAALRIAVE